MTDFRITSRPAGTQVGGVVVASSAARGALPTWDRTFFMDVDPDHMIWGMPALAGKDGLELLREQATAELSSMLLALELEGQVAAQHGRYCRIGV